MQIFKESMKHDPEEIKKFWRDWGMEVDTTNEKELELSLQFYLITTQIEKAKKKDDLINSISKYIK